MVPSDRSAADDLIGVGMRMARVNITMPDELLERARAAELNVSRLAAAAVAEELDRRAKIDALDTYLAQPSVESGPPSEKQILAAREWADQFAERASVADPHSGTP